MSTQTAAAHTVLSKTTYRKQQARRMLRNRWLYLMLLPGILYFLIFKYVPMYGVLIAFKNYQPFLGFWDSQWVGMKHFDRFFGDPLFWKLLRNTFILAVYNIVFFFPLPIVIALMLNELRVELFKRTVQTVVYIPHFMSWVVIVSIVYLFFTTEGGLINEGIKFLGGEKINFLLSQDWFRTFITAEVIWKETGWGTIIFLAALAGVDPGQYEAARIDGANRMQQMVHITLPAIRSTIVILLILRLGHFLDTGFEQIWLMLNAMNREVGEVFDTYVYATGISEGQYSYSTAVGLFKSVVGLVLVAASNYLAKKMGEEGIV
ncbi:ABC transporter permease [Paenibacillus sp. GCM10023248]|uniref:ABC transporter permease n=1 Tax=Bacillales TaxID=1385 RepID=UPI0023780B8C|nr:MULTISPECIES: sugar ABC transporter permease [Bacillales]MDD9269037.1 sugar ABC transporter permease [Paenibacillus sp. MAHUQ-63]MDR6884964.1 putative aldouronate transport system permease protein [Bacillus sp. 3255]